MYGGANSHIAVRVAELDVPAAIGVGELLYRDLESGDGHPPGLCEPHDRGRPVTMLRLLELETHAGDHSRRG